MAVLAARVVGQPSIEGLSRVKNLVVDVRAGRAMRHYKVMKSAEPDDLVFQSVHTGVAMRDNNILSRHIKPAGKKLGIAWVNWRCLRTSHATWLKKAGVHVRDAQALMRHSKASTTLDIYMQVGEDCQREALAKLESIAGSQFVN